ncbi:hypothetical protein [Lysinibacillus sp. G01H]|uniref:hypothetical protein n=1 Tax=Lysinibacillus sp. G01H TaxID=3026425 RepID=UPI00237D64A2|nr:hypothetical protein [Lysinibacillus sp. G01H]WDU80008.1 hypothetical protein PSR12_02370 [Lysinibacillus sp. G01H]
MIIINMIDGEKITVSPDTVLVGINNYSSDKGFYLKQNYVGDIDGNFDKKGSPLNTTDERLGIGGFLLSHQAFSIGEGEDKEIYFTSAVKSISVVD